MVELLKFEDFDQMYSIMEQSFPYDEYRGYEGQKQLFENPEYKVFIHRNEETKDNIKELKGSGIDGIAVVSAIFAAENIENATRELKETVKSILPEE